MYNDLNGDAKIIDMCGVRPNRYSINRLGRIIDMVESAECTDIEMDGGYPVIYLLTDRYEYRVAFPIHYLVACMFCHPPLSTDGCIPVHLNGDYGDYSSENLGWIVGKAYKIEYTNTASHIFDSMIEDFIRTRHSLGETNTEIMNDLSIVPSESTYELFNDIITRNSNYEVY